MKKGSRQGGWICWRTRRRRTGWRGGPGGSGGPKGYEADDGETGGRVLGRDFPEARGQGAEGCAAIRALTEPTRGVRSVFFKTARGSNERGGLYAGHLETPAAAQILAHHLVGDQDHIAKGLGEAGPVALIGARRQPVDLFPHQPAQLVRLTGPAEGTIQGCRLGRFRFAIELTFV